MAVWCSCTLTVLGNCPISISMCVMILSLFKRALANRPIVLRGEVCLNVGEKTRAAWEEGGDNCLLGPRGPGGGMGGGSCPPWAYGAETRIWSGKGNCFTLRIQTRFFFFLNSHFPKRMNLFHYWHLVCFGHWDIFYLFSTYFRSLWEIQDLINILKSGKAQLFSSFESHDYLLLWRNYH